MPDDLTKTRPQDSQRINLSQDYEIRYWCKKFRCTEKELRDAVSLVGDSATAVQTYLSL